MWLATELRQGRPAALLTITGVDGGSPRPVGAQMGIVSGQRFTGYVSGGCVESAVATEVETIIAERQSRKLRFGKGSPYIDIRFPCGGGIDVLVLPAIALEVVETALERLANRQVFALAFDLVANRCTLVDGWQATGWVGDVFYRAYLPVTRLVVAGRGPDFEAVARLGAALGYHVDVATPDIQTLERLAPFAASVLHLDYGWTGHMASDPWTATVLLFHEREWEDRLFEACLGGPQFYLGALGSERTQAARRERLLAKGHERSEVDRIAGPIGIIPQARDPGTLALSVLSEIAIKRRDLDARSSTAAVGQDQVAKIVTRAAGRPG